MPSSRSSSAPHARQWAASSEICEGWAQGFIKVRVRFRVSGQGQCSGTGSESGSGSGSTADLRDLRNRRAVQRRVDELRAEPPSIPHARCQVGNHLAQPTRNRR